MNLNTTKDLLFFKYTTELRLIGSRPIKRIAKFIVNDLKAI